MNYISEEQPRPVVVGARLRRADRLLLKAAAETKGTSLSSYIADAAIRAAREDLGLGSAETTEVLE